MNNKNIWIFSGGTAGFLAVALGAFGAHLLENNISGKMIETYNTGIFYHLLHAVIITVLGLTGNKKFYISIGFFVAGIILFSFSLYLYSVTGIKFLAVVTPFGGVSFLAGWLMIIIRSFKADDGK